MKIAIITTAGISGRFNDGVPDKNRELKAVYYEDDSKKTLLYHLLMKCGYADRIILVGGYKIESLKNYCLLLEQEYRDKITIVYNEHFEDLGSGYSLYLGLREAFNFNPEEILFAEGDLDIDDDSFRRVAQSEKSVLTYNTEPIYADKAVVLYKDDKGQYQYAFSSNHGLLSIASPFSCILNSGQIWKFTEMDALRKANNMFYNESRGDTNLRIIRNYLDAGMDVKVMAFKRWTNCNTRADYKKIISCWEEDV